MTVPVITPLPPAPTRADAPSDFTAKADAFVAAQVGMVAEFNASVEFVDQRAIDADASATAASDSSDLAAQAVQDAADQAALASAARQGAENAELQTQTYAALAGAAAGLPAFTGNGGKYVRVKDDESGVEYGNPGLEVGDLLVTIRTPGADYLPANGGIYLQASYPDLFDIVGIVPDNLAAPWTSVSAGLAFYNGTKVTTDGSGVWIIGGRAGDITRSTDNGVTWSQSVIDSVRLTCLGTDKNGVWILGTEAGAVRRSTDNGATWAPVTVPGIIGFAPGIRAVTDGLGTWVLAGSTKAARSTDNGVTWVALPDFTNAIYGMATDGNGVWVACGSNGAIYRSSDNGASWGSVTSPFGTALVYAVATDGNGVWVAVSSSHYSRSTDNGVTWSAVSTSARGFDVATDGDGVWYALGGGDGFVSNNNGVSWTSFTPGFANRSSIAVGNDKTWIATGNKAVARLFPYTYDPTTQFKIPAATARTDGFSSYIKALEA